MDFEEFREKLMEDLGQDLYENTGAEYSIEATSINKLQNAGYEGIVIRPEDSAVGINLDAESLYKSYNDGKPYEEVFDEAYRMIADGFENQPEFNVEDFSNYDVMKEKLAIQVVSTERNTEMLEKIPHKEVEDMSLVCRFIVGDSKFGQGSILVNNDMLENYGITKEQLFEDAAKYAPELRPSEIMSIADVLAQMMGIDVSELNDQMGVPANPDIPMYVASTHDKSNGAGIIAYPGFMEMAAEKIGGDFFVLPSSVHEVILVPDNGTGDFHELESMVQEVNATQVDPRDQLSDKVYHYDSKDKIFELAEKFDARKKEKDRVEEKGSVLKELESGKKEAHDLSKDKDKKPIKKEEASL